MARIVLATLGSLGDLHPFIAIGLALKARGHDVVLAVPEDHLAKVRASGLEPHALTSSFDTLRQRTGLVETEAQAVRRVLSDSNFLMDKFLMPVIAEGVAALDPLLDGADVLAGSLFAFAAPIAAEKRGVPFVNTVLQPMTLFSRHDPPRTPQFRFLAGPSPSPVGQCWNRLGLGLMRQMLRHRYGGQINAVRAAHGLPPTRDALLLDEGRRAAATLCCYSPVFAPLPPDAPPRAQAVGFPMFDSFSGAPERLDSLEAFLNAGPPPIVFTLGSFAVFAPGDFYAEAARAAKLLGRRAVLLMGEGQSGASDAKVLRCAYAPHSLIFPRVAAIVHHGGAGTTGQALRAGKPQLIVPHMGDQYDNGARIRRLGLGRVIRAERFTAPLASATLSSLLADADGLARAERIADVIAQEDGAGNAARALEAIAARGLGVAVPPVAEAPSAGSGAFR